MGWALRVAWLTAAVYEAAHAGSLPRHQPPSVYDLERAKRWAGWAERRLDPGPAIGPEWRRGSERSPEPSARQDRPDRWRRGVRQ